VKFKPTEATEYLKNNRLHPHEEFVVDLTAHEFDELHSSIKELRGRIKWIEPFSSDDDLNAFLREVVRADLQMRFIETFPPTNETEWEIYVSSRQVIQDTSRLHGSRRHTCRSRNGRLQYSNNAS
jgi:hypothetical protein